MDQREYILRVLEAYRSTPGTCGLIRRPDRILAAQLHERGVPLTVLENALALATVRSLACFLPVIDEVLATDVDPSYYQHVRNKLQRLTTSR